MSYQPLSSPFLLPFNNNETGIVLDDPENVGLIKTFFVTRDEQYFCSKFDNFRH